MAYDEHSLFRENLPAYALGALDAEEIPALEAHLQTCDACRAELAEHRAVGDSLLAALPPRQPSPRLRRRLMSRLPSAQGSERQPFTFSFSRLALGTAFILLLVMNLFSLMQLREIRSQQAGFLHQLQNNQLALAMLSYPATQTLAIRGENVSGTLLLDRERNAAALIAWNLAPLSADQTYQVWLIEPDEDRVSAGLFRPQESIPYTTQPVYTERSLLEFIGIGVTVEPAGGSEQPTGPRVFRVDF